MAQSGMNCISALIDCPPMSSTSLLRAGAFSPIQACVGMSRYVLCDVSLLCKIHFTRIAHLGRDCEGPVARGAGLGDMEGSSAAKLASLSPADLCIAFGSSMRGCKLLSTVYSRNR